MGDDQFDFDGASSGGEDAASIAPAALQKELSSFIEKYGLTGEATAELSELFSTSYRRLAAQIKAPGPTYRWDQIHEMIVSHSKDTSLVILNLPDPPDFAARAADTVADGAGGGGDDAEAAQRDAVMAEMLEYMNYMEGVAENLPRVLYVHGSGQEIINFDKME